MMQMPSQDETCNLMGIWIGERRDKGGGRRDRCLSWENTLMIGEAAKKVLLLISGPSRPNPPPLELNGTAIKRRIFFCGFP